MSRTAVATSSRLYIAGIDELSIDAGYGTWMRDPAVVRYLEARFADVSRAALIQFIGATNAASNQHLFGVFLLGSDRYIGNIKLTVDSNHKRAEIGLLIGDTTVRGQGFGSEVIALAAAHAFKTLGAVKVTAGCYGTNRASIRAFEKVGFEVEARRPAHYISEGMRVEGVYLALWAPNQRRPAGDAG